MTDIQITLLVVIPILLIIITLILVLPKKKKVVVVETTELKAINEALGLGNVLTVTKVNDRLQLTIKDKNLINVNSLKELNIIATIKGLELTILYRKDSELLYNYLKEQVDASKKN